MHDMTVVRPLPTLVCTTSDLPQETKDIERWVPSATLYPIINLSAKFPSLTQAKTNKNHLKSKPLNVKQ